MFTQAKKVRDAVGNFILVQSSVKSCPQLLNSVNLHLEAMRKKIQNMTDDEFKTNVDATISKITVKDNNQKEEY